MPTGPPTVADVLVVYREVARRLRENDGRGDDGALRTLGATAIEQLCKLVEEQERVFAKYGRTE